MSSDMVRREDFLVNEVIDLAPEMALISPTDTPLLTLLYSKNKVVPAVDTMVTWRERKLNQTRGTLRIEGDDAGDVIVSEREMFSNVCQIIEKVTEISGTADSLRSEEFDEEIYDRLIELKRDLEWYCLNGEFHLESDATEEEKATTGHDVIPRQMNGLLNLVNEANVIDASEGLDSEHLITALEMMWNHGFTGECYAFVGADVKRQINSLYRFGETGEAVYTESNILLKIIPGIGQSFGFSVGAIQSDFGTVHFVLDRHMDKSTILIVDLDNVELAELRGTFYEDLSVEGDSRKGHVVNESSIKLMNSYFGVKIVNIPLVHESVDEPIEELADLFGENSVEDAGSGQTVETMSPDNQTNDQTIETFEESGSSPGDEPSVKTGEAENSEG